MIVTKVSKLSILGTLQFHGCESLEHKLLKQGNYTATRYSQGFLTSTTITPDYANSIDYRASSAAGSAPKFGRVWLLIMAFGFRQTRGLDSGGYHCYNERSTSNERRNEQTHTRKSEVGDQNLKHFTMHQRRAQNETSASEAEKR